MSHTAVHESRPSYCKKVHQRRTCSTHHSLTRKSILMITHNLVGYSIEFCNNSLGLQRLRLDRHVTNPSRTQRRESSCEYRSTHISRSAYDTSFIGSQFRSVIVIRLFTQNCLVFIDPAYLQKLRVGVFLTPPVGVAEQQVKVTLQGQGTNATRFRWRISHVLGRSSRISCQERSDNPRQC